MNPARAFLLEHLDACGADARDAALRAAALEVAGYATRTVAVATSPAGAAPAGGARPPTLGPGADGRRAMLALLEGWDPALAIVAAAAPGGGCLARWLPRGLAARWWPSGWSDGASRGPRAPWSAAPTLPALVGEGPVAALDWTPIDTAAPDRARRPLWDGDYLLAPQPFGGPAGRDALEAFARLGAARCGLDLVVLGDPEPALARLARARGVAPRVHFVGRATRGAEASWLAGASTAVLAGRGPLAGSLVLRVLAAGCPLLVGASGAAADALRGRLEACGAAAAVWPPGVVGLAAALERVLERGEPVRRAIARGRELAAGADPGAIGERLRDALGGAAPRRAAA